jgi:glucose-6-phosphate isomerase
MTSAPRFTPPAALRVDPASGRMEPATRHYEKRLRDLSGLYADEAAFGKLLVGQTDAVVYEVWEHRASSDAGDLVFGTSVMKPGQVGDEFFLTRGHQHARADRAETYFCQAGRGVMLMEAPDGAVSALEMTPGIMLYVPPFWIHRSVNVGEGTLVTVFCYDAAAGQDYGIIERSGGMRSRVVADGKGGWRLVENPRWRLAR